MNSKNNSLIFFVKKIYFGQDNLKGFSKKLINSLKVFIISFRKFNTDDCLTKASSIAYAIIISLIPTLTVILTFYSKFSGVGDKKEDFFNRISLFMLEHNIKINIDPVLAAISGLIDNAGKIGGVGAVLMIFTATAMLRSLEKSLNHIWRVKKNRPFFLKIVFYWATLTLGPLLIIASTTVASKISESLSSPNYNSAVLNSDNQIWLSGNKATLAFLDSKNIRPQKIDLRMINFENQKIYSYNRKNRKFIRKDLRIELAEFKKTEFVDIDFFAEQAWVVSRNGIILHRQNSNSNWTLKKWGSFHFNDLEMISDKKGFIAADNGFLLITKDGGETWHLKEWPNFTANLKSINFYGRTGIITGSGSTILFSQDLGETWKIKSLNLESQSDKMTIINNSYLVDERNIWLVGNNGLIIKSSDSGHSWEDKRFKNFNYKTIVFLSKKEGFVAGNKGIFLKTNDEGENWQIQKVPTHQTNKLLLTKQKIWAIGQNGTVLVTVNKGKSWQGIEGKSTFNLIINFLAPFLFIWLLFLLIYISLPNLKVPIKFAAIGATFTGATWVFFILLFNFYIKSFAQGTFSIYGALASIPLFLLMLYISSLIILFGAEIAYTLMHPESYQSLNPQKNIRNSISVYEGIILLHYIYEKFEKGGKTSTLQDLWQNSSLNKDTINFFLKIFLEDELIIQVDEEEYSPANSSANIKVKDFINLINDINFKIPMNSKETFIKEYLKNIFKEINISNENIIGHLTLKDFIK